MLAWRAIQVAYGHEREAARVLSGLSDIEGFCPSARARWWERGHIVEKPVPLITSYAFARWDTEYPGLWYDVMAVKAVYRIIGGEDPKPVYSKVFDAWVVSADLEWCIPEATLRFMRLRRGYAEGDEVIINHRALRGVHGLVRFINEKKVCARVEYNLMGRPQTAFVPLASLVAVHAVWE